MEFVRRIGPDPHAHGDDTPSAQGCPDMWEMSDGSIAIIGQRATANLLEKLPPSVGCGPDEEIVVFPRAQLIAARDDIVDLR